MQICAIAAVGPFDPHGRAPVAHPHPEVGPCPTPMSVVQATSSVTLNDIRARILRLPRALREAIPRGRDTLDIRVAAIDFYGALTISSGHAYLGGVTELFRRLGVLRSGDTGLEGRTTRVSWSYEPESGIAALEPSIDDPWQLLPGTALAEDPSPSPTDPAVLVAEALARFTPEREAARRKAVDDARDFVQGHLGTFSPDDTRELLRLFNVDHGNGRMKADRFAPGFTGSLANDIAASTDVLNRWIPQLWEASDDEAVARVLDAFWAAKDVPGAGRSLPTMLLHVRDPERWFPIMTSLAKGYTVLTGQPARGRNGARYLEYARGLVELRRTHDVPVHATDLVLMEAARAGATLRAISIEPEPAGLEAAVRIEDVPDDEDVYDRAAVMADTLLPEAELDEIELLLSEKPQLVLYGPPGTGKTWLAERLGRYLTRHGGEVRLVQFHPSYGYEDFVEGIRPVLAGDAAQVGYRVEPGIFRQLCEQARKRPKETFVLVVDEINRGNLPRIFGELLYLLERRGPDHQVELPISRQSFSVPRNLVLLGTMNTADQSIALVDVALRRRFHFVELRPDAQLLREWLSQHAPKMAYVATVLDKLNDALRKERIDDNLLIGHTHFMRRGLDELALKRVWDRSIVPTLEEYFYGKRDKIAQFRFETFVEVDAAASEEEPG